MQYTSPVKINNFLADVVVVATTFKEKELKGDARWAIGLTTVIFTFQLHPNNERKLEAIKCLSASALDVVQAM